MLSRAERIVSELLVSRGLVAKDVVETCARIKEDSPAHVSLGDVLVERGHLSPEIEKRVLEEAAGIDRALTPALPGGGQLGEFRIVRELGRGGMGIVYEAEQQTLHRRVAVKVLSAGAALDERLAIRFVREAQAAGRLNHPGIVKVITSGQAAGLLYFAMELVEGRSLADRIEEGPLDPEEAASIAARVCRAVAHAHEANIVHRDIKPDNILLEPGGEPRVTDFGLAHDAVAGSAGISRHVLGTPAYMAPEQARGAPADPKADVYCLGAVLYAMLAGGAPYRGDVPAAVLARVLTEPPPPLVARCADAPGALVAICERAMAREPKQRYGSAEEMAEALEGFLETGDATPSSSAFRTKSAPAPRKLAPWIVSGALALAVLAVAALSLVRRGGTLPTRPPARAESPFRRLQLPPGTKRAPTLSRDGSLLAYDSDVDGDGDIYLHKRATVETANLTADSPADDRGPVLSRDGRRLMFSSWRDITASSYAMDVETGNTRRVGPGRYANDWSPDGRRVLFLVHPGEVVPEGIYTSEPDPGGVPKLLRGGSSLFGGSGVRGRIRWSPQGRRISYPSLAGGRTDLWTMSAEGDAPIRVTDDDVEERDGVWAPDGRHLYYGAVVGAMAELWRTPIDEQTGAITGPPELLVRDIPADDFSLASSDREIALVAFRPRENIFALPFDSGTGTIGDPMRATAEPRLLRLARHPDASRKGLLFTGATDQEDLWLVEPGGRTRRLAESPSLERGARFSPDATRIAFESNRSGTSEIWILDLDEEESKRFTNTGGLNATFPVWSPDGRRIAFTVEGEGGYVIAVENGAAPQRLSSPANGAVFEPWSWSPDGKTLAGTAGGITLLDVAGGHTERITEGGERPTWLHDGRRLLYTKDGAVFLADRISHQEWKVFAPVVGAVASGLALSPDEHEVYLSVAVSNEDVWVADFEDLVRTRDPRTGSRQ